MLEKEAEISYWDSDASGALGSKESYVIGFKDGYNKAKVEVEESYRESLCNSELNLARVTEQLEELEKEAKEYALEWGDKTDGTYACCRDGYLAGAEPRDKRIEELEKENAELKEKLKPENCLKYLAKRGYVKFVVENGNEHEYISKAKEIIQTLSTCLEGHHTNSFEYEQIKQAEAFLSEVEK